MHLTYQYLREESHGCIAASKARSAAVHDEDSYDVVSRVFIPWQVNACSAEFRYAWSRARLTERLHSPGPPHALGAACVCRSYVAAVQTALLTSNISDCVVQGINEDFATGSAHCILGPLFGEVLERRIGIRCWQCSSRGGAMTLDVKPEGSTVTITALACLRSRGSLSWDTSSNRWSRT